MRRPPARMFVLASFAIALALAGCGRKGNLELPADVKDTPQAEGQPEGLPAGTAPKEVQERPFILDALL